MPFNTLSHPECPRSIFWSEHMPQTSERHLKKIKQLERDRNGHSFEGSLRRERAGEGREVAEGQRKNPQILNPRRRKALPAESRLRWRTFHQDQECGRPSSSPCLFARLFPLLFSFFEHQLRPSCLPLGEEGSAAVAAAPKGGGCWLLWSGDNLLASYVTASNPCL